MLYQHIDAAKDYKKKKSKPKTRFTIGSYVLCTAKVKFNYFEPVENPNKRTYIKESCEYLGWVVGAVRRYEGNYTAGKEYGTFYDGPDYQPPFFTATKSYLLWKVANSLTAKPIEVFDEDIYLASCVSPAYINNVCIESPYAPLCDTNPYKNYPCTDQVKQVLRECVQDAPRDEKGKWIKTPRIEK